MREPEKGSRGQGGGASGTGGAEEGGGEAAGHTHGLLRPEAAELGGERPLELFCISSVICLPQLI